VAETPAAVEQESPTITSLEIRYCCSACGTLRAVVVAMPDGGEVRRRGQQPAHPAQVAMRFPFRYADGS
jgi:hypothetical protein